MQAAIVVSFKSFPEKCVETFQVLLQLAENVIGFLLNEVNLKFFILYQL